MQWAPWFSDFCNAHHLPIFCNYVTSHLVISSKKFNLQLSSNYLNKNNFHVCSAFHNLMDWGDRIAKNVDRWWRTLPNWNIMEHIENFVHMRRQLYRLPFKILVDQPRSHILDVKLNQIKATGTKYKCNNPFSPLVQMIQKVPCPMLKLWNKLNKHVLEETKFNC